jgi:hypothetical protein
LSRFQLVAVGAGNEIATELVLKKGLTSRSTITRGLPKTILGNSIATDAEPDEPMFVLLARDISAPFLVRLWADKNFKKTDKRAEALAIADAMEEWQRREVAR